MNSNVKLNFVLDLDGIFTDGSFYYSVDGKIMKKFGAHDSDGIKMIKDKIKILVITADKKGFEISRKRMNDLQLELKYVDEYNRYDFCQKFGMNNLIYMGDGFYDSEILKNCFFGITTPNAVNDCKENADYITSRLGGNGAVFEACKIVKEKFL